MTGFSIEVRSMYDFLLEVGYAIYRNGFSVTALGAVFYVVFKQRRIKRIIKKYIPFLSEDESEVKGYIENQHIIIHNLKIMMEGMGIKWSVPTSNENLKVTQKKKNKWFYMLSVMRLRVRSVKQYIILIRRNTNMNKLKSRKFWMAVVGAALVVLNDGLELGIDNETVLAAAGLLMTWIIGESAVDTVKTKKKDDDVDFTQDTGV